MRRAKSMFLVFFTNSRNKNRLLEFFFLHDHKYSLNQLVEFFFYINKPLTLRNKLAAYVLLIRIDLLFCLGVASLNNLHECGNNKRNVKKQ